MNFVGGLIHEGCEGNSEVGAIGFLERAAAAVYFVPKASKRGPKGTDGFDYFN